MRKVVSNRVTAVMVNASWIRKMFSEGGKLIKQHGPENVFDYTLGNPSFDPPIEVQKRLAELTAEPKKGMHGYMDNAGYDFVRRDVATWLNVQQGLSTALTENHVVMTVGAGGALNVVLKCILNPGEEVVVPAPFFVEYGFYVDNHGGKLVPVDAKADFQPDLEAMENAINPNTKAVLINSPNNPTGAVYPRETLEQMQRLLAAKEEKYNHAILLISDEPYSGIIYDGVEVPPVLQIFPHSVLATSYSKSLCLAGERIGYLAISPLLPEAEQLFGAASFANRTLGFVNPVALMQRAIVGHHHLTVGVEKLKERRDMLFDALTSMNYKVQKPQGAFYMFPKSPVHDDVAFCQSALRYLLLIVPGTGFGMEGYFRLSFSGIEPGQITRSLPAFEALAREYYLI